MVQVIAIPIIGRVIYFKSDVHEEWFDLFLARVTAFAIFPIAFG